MTKLEREEIEKLAHADRSKSDVMNEDWNSFQAFKRGAEAAFQLRDEREAMLVAALEFYGSPDTWKDTPERSSPISGDMTNGPSDFGHNARNTLAEYRKGRGDGTT